MLKCAHTETKQKCASGDLETFSNREFMDMVSKIYTRIIDTVIVAGDMRMAH